MRNYDFKLYWLNGKTEIISGFTIIDAMHNAGISVSDSLNTLHHWERLN